jgi:hypothetical protein
MLDLQAGDSCFSFSLRHLAIRPSPGLTSLQYFATSSAQGPFAAGMSAAAATPMDSMAEAKTINICFSIAFPFIRIMIASSVGLIFES